jgi:hypothetical protein
MKHSQNHDHGRSHENGRHAEPQLVPVRFEFTHPTAIVVGIAGASNDWHPEAKATQPIWRGKLCSESAVPKFSNLSRMSAARQKPLTSPVAERT